MSGIPLLARAAPLLVVWPAHAAAAADQSSWASSEVGGVAVLGVVAAYAWHQVAGHRGEIADRWRHVHVADRWHALHVRDRVRHALEYARAHAHL